MVFFCRLFIKSQASVVSRANHGHQRRGFAASSVVMLKLMIVILPSYNPGRF